MTRLFFLRLCALMKIDKAIMRGHLVNKIFSRLEYILGNRIMKSRKIGGFSMYFADHKIFLAMSRRLRTNKYQMFFNGFYF